MPTHCSTTSVVVSRARRTGPLCASRLEKVTKSGNKKHHLPCPQQEREQSPQEQHGYSQHLEQLGRCCARLALREAAQQKTTHLKHLQLLKKSLWKGKEIEFATSKLLLKTPG